MMSKLIYLIIGPVAQINTSVSRLSSRNIFVIPITCLLLCLLLTLNRSNLKQNQMRWKVNKPGEFHLIVFRPLTEIRLEPINDPISYDNSH